MMAKDNGSKVNDRRKERKGKGAFASLSPRHKTFVLNYLKLKCNGTRAYLASYDADGAKKMSDATARANASRLLSNVNIQAAIAEKANEPLRDLEINVEKVLRGLVATGLLPLSTWADWDQYGNLKIKGKDELPEELWLPVSEIVCERTPTGSRTKIKVSRNNAMLQTLAEILKMIPPRKIGIGLPQEETGEEASELSQLPGQHGYPPMPATIEEWEAQVRQAELARLIESKEEKNQDRAPRT